MNHRVKRVLIRSIKNLRGKFTSNDISADELFDEATAVHFDTYEAAAFLAEEIGEVWAACSDVIKAHKLKSLIDPDQAYSVGYANMAIACKNALSFNGDSSLKDFVEKCWVWFEFQVVEVGVPPIHALAQEHYDRGIHKALLDALCVFKTKNATPSNKPANGDVYIM